MNMSKFVWVTRSVVSRLSFHAYCFMQVQQPSAGPVIQQSNMFEPYQSIFFKLRNVGSEPDENECTAPHTDT